MEEIVQYLIMWASWGPRPLMTLDLSEVDLFISHIPQVTDLRLKPTKQTKRQNKTEPKTSSRPNHCSVTEMFLLVGHEEN